MANDDRTIGEIGRLLDSVLVRLESLVSQLDATYLRKDLFESRMDTVEDRLEKIESRGEWIVRTVGALIIAGVFSAVFVVQHLHG
jgi:hypothetical protein